MSGVRLKKYRLDNNYSQKELANILGVSARTVVRWEQNTTRPSPDEAQRIAAIIGVTADELVNDEDESENSLNNTTKQELLNRISDSVDNLVTGQETINSSLLSNRQEDDIRQDRLIRELKEQNEQLLLKIESYEKALDNNKFLIRHKRVQTSVIVITCIIILALVIAAWINWNNHGFDNKYAMGSIETGTPSYFVIDDEQ